MNERIEKFIDDAKLTAVSEMFESELEKFAELIVAECVGAIMTKERHRAEYFARVVQRRFGILDDGDDDE